MCKILQKYIFQIKKKTNKMGAKATRELHCASVTLCGVFESLIFKCTASGSLSLALSLSHTDTHKHTHTH